MFNFLFTDEVAAANSRLIDLNLNLTIKINFWDLSQNFLIEDFTIEASMQLIIREAGASMRSKTRRVCEKEDRLFSKSRENRDYCI